MSLTFSDTSTKLGMIQACERYTGLGDTAISGSATLLKEFTAHINQQNRKVWFMLFQAFGGWQYDDSNQTDLPYATTTLVASQTGFAIPANAVTIKGVEILNEGGVWEKLSPIALEQIQEYSPIGEFFNVAGTPRYYQLIGRTLKIYPKSDTTTTSGLKVFFDRGSVDFASTDTTKTPGFIGEFHDILPIGASLEWLKINKPGDGTTANLRADFNESQNNIKKFYQARFQEEFPPKLRVNDALLSSF